MLISHIVSTWFCKRQKYESPERAWWEPVLRTGDESGNSIAKRRKWKSSKAGHRLPATHELTVPWTRSNGPVPVEVAIQNTRGQRGKELFDKKCAICHFADSDQKKIGPGLKGISKRGTFSVNGNKVTTESLKAWIENGDSQMPPFKDVLEPAQIKDVVAYVKTL